MAMTTNPTPSRLNHHSGLRDDSHAAIGASKSSLPVARGRGATGGAVSWMDELYERGGGVAAGGCVKAGDGQGVGAARLWPTSSSTDRCSAAIAFSIRERRATISSSLDGSIIAAPGLYPFL